jgi:hypothetical protein
MTENPRAPASNRSQPTPARDESRRFKKQSFQSEWIESLIMSRNVSFLGVVLGVIAGALIAMFSGMWMFWLVLGVTIGVLLGGGGARRKSDRLSGHHLHNRQLPGNRQDFGQGASL